MVLSGNFGLVCEPHSVSVRTPKKKKKKKKALMGNLAQVINQTKRPFLNAPCAHASGAGPRTEQFKKS